MMLVRGEPITRRAWSVACLRPLRGSLISVQTWWRQMRSRRMTAIDGCVRRLRIKVVRTSIRSWLAAQITRKRIKQRQERYSQRTKASFKCHSTTKSMVMSPKPPKKSRKRAISCRGIQVVFWGMRLLWLIHQWTCLKESMTRILILILKEVRPVLM